MKKYMRKGIAMIELIFAIVILAIVLMSAPMLISTATTSGYVALQQEAIASSSAQMGMILTHQWDEFNTDDTRTASVLVAQGDADLNELVVAGINTGRRAGTPLSSNRRFSDSLGLNIPATPVANLGSDAGDMDDIDDFITNAVVAVHDEEAALSTTGDIVDKSIQISVNVGYISDAPGGSTYLGSSNTLTLHLPFSNPAVNTSNIKHVQVRLTTANTEEELEKNILLNAFSCNIGTYQLNQRTFP